MKIEVSQNEEISAGGKNGEGKGSVASFYEIQELLLFYLMLNTKKIV